MRALLLLLLLCPTLAATTSSVHNAALAIADDADEQARFIAGLFEEQHHDMVVKQARQFLKDFPRDERTRLVRYRLASSLFELGQAGDAIPHYRTLAADSAFEYRAESQLRLGQCELLAGHPKRAREALAAALAGSQDYLKPTAAFFLAEAEFQLEDHEQAIGHYQACLRSEQAAAYHAHAQRGIAWCHFREGQWHACRQTARKFLNSAPRHELAAEVQFLMGDAAFQADDMDGAAKAWKKVPAGDWQAAALRGQAWVQSKRADDQGAAVLFARLLEAEPEGRFAHEAALQCGVHLLRAGKHADALAVLKLPAAGNGSETLYWRARAQTAAGNGQAALDLLERASRAADNDLRQRIATARGDLLFDLGRLDESAQAYGQDASDYALHAGATASLNAGQPQQALKLAERFLEEYPESSYATSTSIVRAESLFVLQDYKRASEAFATLVRSPQLEDAQAPGVRSRLAWCQFLQGDLPLAARSFGELCKRYPASAEASEARYMQGRALSESGQPEAAVEAWQRYVDEYPDAERRPDALLQLARLTGSAEPLQQLLDDFPRHDLAASAWIELAEHESRAGHVELAIAHYGAYLERFPTHSGVPQARYALAWELRESGDALAAKEQLRQLLGAGAPDELLLSSLELAVWCASDLQGAQECEDIWRAFAARCEDERRLFSVAQVVAQAWQAAGAGSRADAVLSSLTKRLKSADVRLDLLIERVWCALENAAPEKAEALTREALALAAEDPRVLEAAFFVGEECFAAGQYERAADFYARAAHPRNADLVDEALYKLGFSQLSLEQNALAASSFERLVNEQANSALAAESLYLAGEARFRAGEFAACRKHMQRFRKQHARHEVRPKVLHRLGLAANALGEHQQANDALTELLSTTPDFELRIEARYEQGLALLQLKRARAARAALDAVLAETRNSDTDSLFAARARLALAELDTQSGDLDSALSHYLKVSLLYAEGEEVRDAKLGAARVLEAQGEQRLAIKKYTELKANAPRSSQGKAAARRLVELKAL